jgi:hypothetical protein
MPLNRLAAQAVIASVLVALGLPACSPETRSATGAGTAAESKILRTTPEQAPPPARLPPAHEKAPPAGNVLTLEGLGILRIGDPVPAGSSWGERGAQIPGGCRTISSPDFLGVYAIVEEGVVRRITVGGQSKVKLTEGVGPGASEAEVRAAFPGVREEPHKYVESPAKYLTSPSAASGDPALRFEIDLEGGVGLMHVGTMPVLGYVEGCA